MRYQRIHTKIWNDEKFSSLSSAGQRLFLYLLSSPHSNLLGIYVLKPEYACGDLKSLMKDFKKDLVEVLGRALVKYDPENNVVFLPKYLRYNPLTNPNQVKAAIAIIRDLPQTPFLQDLKALVEGLSEGLTKGLLEVLPKPVTVTVTEAEAVTVTEEKECAVSCEKSTAQPPTPKIEFEVTGFKNITAMNKEKWSRAYPALNIEHELLWMETWVMANPKNRKSNWHKFIVNWLSRSQDKAPGTKRITWKDVEAREKELERKKHEANKLIPALSSLVKETKMGLPVPPYDKKAEDCTNPKKANCKSPYCEATCRFRGIGTEAGRAICQPNH